MSRIYTNPVPYQPRPVSYAPQPRPVSYAPQPSPGTQNQLFQLAALDLLKSNRRTNGFGWFILVLVILLLGAFAGVAWWQGWIQDWFNIGGNATNDACKLDTDCESGKRCSGTGKCVDCLDSLDCDENFLCGPNSVCLPECGLNKDCESGYCNDGVCVECIVGSQCPDGQSCSTDFTCVPECTGDSDCPSGKICSKISQTCVFCDDNTDCGTPSTGSGSSPPDTLTEYTCQVLDGLARCVKDVKECDENNPCSQDGFECLNFKCEPPECTLGQPCPAGNQECSFDELLQRNNCVPKPCSDSNPCAFGECVRDTIACSADTDCPEGDVCTNGACGTIADTGVCKFVCDNQTPCGLPNQYCNNGLCEDNPICVPNEKPCKEGECRKDSNGVYSCKKPLENSCLPWIAEGDGIEKENGKEGCRLSSNGETLLYGILAAVLTAIAGFMGARQRNKRKMNALEKEAKEVLATEGNKKRSKKKKNKKEKAAVEARGRLRADSLGAISLGLIENISESGLANDQFKIKAFSELVSASQSPQGDNLLEQTRNLLAKPSVNMFGFDADALVASAEIEKIKNSERWRDTNFYTRNGPVGPLREVNKDWRTEFKDQIPPYLGNNQQFQAAMNKEYESLKNQRSIPTDSIELIQGGKFIFTNPTLEKIFQDGLKQGDREAAKSKADNLKDAKVRIKGKAGELLGDFSGSKGNPYGFGDPSPIQETIVGAGGTGKGLLASFYAASMKRRFGKVVVIKIDNKKLGDTTTSAAEYYQNAIAVARICKQMGIPCLIFFDEAQQYMKAQNDLATFIDEFQEDKAGDFNILFTSNDAGFLGKATPATKGAFLRRATKGGTIRDLDLTPEAVESRFSTGLFIKAGTISERERERLEGKIERVAFLAHKVSPYRGETAIRDWLATVKKGFAEVMRKLEEFESGLEKTAESTNEVEQLRDARETLDGGK